jgi:hypothetical protein
MRKYNGMQFANGSVYDLGQTINGISKFIVLNGKWYYYSERLIREYEYNGTEIDELIRDGEYKEFLGNIFSHIPE